MLIDIKLSGFKLKQGNDYPYQDDINVSISNHIDQNGMMVLEIEGSEYHFDKKEFKKTIEILNMES